MRMPDSFVTSRKTPGRLRGRPPAARPPRRAPRAIRPPIVALEVAGRLPHQGRTPSRTRPGTPRARRGRVRYSADERAMRLAVRERELAVARVVHAVERQRLDGLSRDRVLVRVLVPAVEHDEVVAHPARRKRRQAARVEVEPHAVPALHDDVAVVGRGQRARARRRSACRDRPCRPSGARVDTSSWTKTCGPSAESRACREKPRKKRRAETSGAGVTRSGAGASSTVYAIRSQ